MSSRSNRNDRVTLPSQRRRSWRPALWRVVRGLMICYLVVMLVMMLLENRLIFLPRSYSSDDWQPAFLEFEDVHFRSDDGTKLHGWYVPCEGARATILFCHGNAGNLSHRAEMLHTLHQEARASVMTFDYRGYGHSEGRPNEMGVLADARAARAWLAKREGIAESRIVMMGRSLGGAVAVDLAAKDGARALVLESTFTSIPDIASHYYPWLPVRWLMRTRLDSLDKIPGYDGPLLQTHSETDTLVPFEFGRQLFEAAKASRPRKFITYGGIDHNDPQPPDYYAELAAFLDAI